MRWKTKSLAFWCNKNVRMQGHRWTYLWHTCNLVTYQPTHGPILYRQKYVLCVFLCFCSGGVFHVLVLSLVPIMRNCTSTAYNNNVLDNSVFALFVVLCLEKVFSCSRIFQHVPVPTWFVQRFFFFFFAKKVFGVCCVRTLLFCTDPYPLHHLWYAGTWARSYLPNIFPSLTNILWAEREQIHATKF